MPDSLKCLVVCAALYGMVRIHRRLRDAAIREDQAAAATVRRAPDVIDPYAYRFPWVLNMTHHELIHEWAVRDAEDHLAAWWDTHRGYYPTSPDGR